MHDPGADGERGEGAAERQPGSAGSLPLFSSWLDER